jgi:hypothetical protein
MAQDRITPFITFIKRWLSEQEWFTEKGFTKQSIFKQFLPQNKEPNWPCITIAYELDKRDVGLGTDEGALYITVHSKDFNFPDEVAQLINNALHDKKHSNDDFVLYQCFATGNATTPIFNQKWNNWESVCEFSFKVG